MRIALLGPVELSHDGQRIRLNGSKQLALLALLALNGALAIREPGRPVTGPTDGPASTTYEAIGLQLRARRALLILDNCEHLVAAVGQAGWAAAGRLPGVAPTCHQPRTVGSQR